MLYLLDVYSSSFAVHVHIDSYRAGAHYSSLRLVSVAEMEPIVSDYLISKGGLPKSDKK